MAQQLQHNNLLNQLYTNVIFLGGGGFGFVASATRRIINADGTISNVRRAVKLVHVDDYNRVFREIEYMMGEHVHSHIVKCYGSYIVERKTLNHEWQDLFKRPNDPNQLPTMILAIELELCPGKEQF